MPEHISTTEQPLPVETAGPDTDMIKRALRGANMNTLRIAIYQVTRDPRLAAMRLERVPTRGGVLNTFAVAPEHHDELIDIAFEYVMDRSRRDTAPAKNPPTTEDVRNLLNMYGGEPLTDQEFEFAREELAFEQFPRDVNWENKPSDETIGAFHVVVVGAGISGIAAAIQLKRLGIPYTVIERQHDIGGIWQLNTYPEARVDTTNYLYQFKFERDFRWSTLFPARDETQSYLHHVVKKYGIADNITLNTEVVAAIWQESTSKWLLTLRNGDSERQIEANAVISCSGLFSTPKFPDIPGIESFQGDICHTAAWNHDIDYTGKRVGLIGNGSTGSQLMPHLAACAGKLTVFQRTPQWISAMEKYREPISDEMRWLWDNIPYYLNWSAYSAFHPTTQMQYIQTFDEEWQSKGGTISEGNDKLRTVLTQYIMGKVGHRPDLVEKCIPSYAPLGRRMVVDNGWYDSLLRDNVELVTDGIDHMTADGIVTKTGEEHKIDFLAISAGYHASRYLHPVNYVGRNGVDLDSSWKDDGARAYLGITVPGLPNLFIVYGPNGQPRGAGFYSWAEIWARYIVKAITQLIENGHRSLEVKPEIFSEYNQRLDRETENIIWEKEGGTNYYINEHGRQAVNMPFLMHEYHSWVREPKHSDYIWS